MPLESQKRADDEARKVAVNELQTENADLRRKVADLIYSYELKVEQLMAETRRTSAALEVCAKRGIRSPRHLVGEAGLGWDAALEAVEAAIRGAGREQ